VVTLNGRDIYLGKWNTEASRAEYDQRIGEWLAGGRCLPSSLEALARFFQALSSADSPQPRRSSAQRRRAADAAQRELERQGL
jgi:hypothetical protein